MKVAISSFVFFAISLFAAEYFPTEWIKQDLNLAQFFINYGDVEEKTKTLQEILELGCKSGNLNYITWAIEKQKEMQLPVSLLDIPNTLKKMVLGGFDDILLHMPYFVDFSLIDSNQRKALVDLALKVGYPRTVLTLQKLGFCISEEQRVQLDEWIDVFNEEIDITEPKAINSTHEKAHGGKDNKAIYRREYNQIVSYCLYRMRKQSCDFKDLIEDLGYRRRHMAALCRLSGIEEFGAQTDQICTTFYDPTYIDYGKRIREKFSQLPFMVKARLNGRMLYLTQLNDDSWIHPDGEYRSEILDHVNAMCGAAALREYGKERVRELAYDLGKIVWWLAHAPPFLRGTPTVISTLVDAFWLYHYGIPFIKCPDITCEALSCASEEEFALYMYNRDDLP